MTSIVEAERIEQFQSDEMMREIGRLMIYFSSLSQIEI